MLSSIYGLEAAGEQKWARLPECQDSLGMEGQEVRYCRHFRASVCVCVCVCMCVYVCVCVCVCVCME